MDHPASSATIMVPGDTPVSLKHTVECGKHKVIVVYADGHERALDMEDYDQYHEAHTIFDRLNS